MSIDWFVHEICAKRGPKKETLPKEVFKIFKPKPITKEPSPVFFLVKNRFYIRNFIMCKSIWQWHKTFNMDNLYLRTNKELLEFVEEHEKLSRGVLCEDHQIFW